MASRVKLLPRPLLDEIVRGRWLPVVGSGLSRNAVVPSGSPPPDWNGLATALRSELSDPDDSGDAVDLISAYSYEHGRPALIERVASQLRIADAVPGPVHLSLCRLPIELLVTTNFDFLLERAFDQVGKPCHPVVDEHQLSLNNPYPGPTLFKLHGDVNRPERLVMTEEDFDRFLVRNPLLATVVASHFAQLTPVLIGYSLSDPDLRQVLALVRERLGTGSRTMYALEVDPAPSKVARFERRGVKVVSLPGSRRDPAPTLERLFDEVFSAIPDEARDRLVPRSHESGLALRSAPLGRSCFLSAPLASQADYEEWIVPEATELGVSIVRVQDFAAPGDSIVALVESVISTVGCAILEVSSTFTFLELGMVLNRLGRDKAFLVTHQPPRIPSDISGIRFAPKPTDAQEWLHLSSVIASWLVETLGVAPPAPTHHPAAAETIGAIMIAATDLERTVGDRLRRPLQSRSLSRMVEEAFRSGLINEEEVSMLRQFASLRNAAAHGAPSNLQPREVRHLLQAVNQIVAKLAGKPAGPQ